MGRTATRPTRVHHVFTLGAKIATAMAALATVLGYVHSVGLDGSRTRRTVGTFGATWMGLAPATDTATSIGDTLHLAATVTDRHGTALGATIGWAPATDAAGAVRARWTLPAVAGTTTFHLSGRVDGIVHPVDVVATSAAAPPPAASRRRHPAT